MDVDEYSHDYKGFYKESTNQMYINRGRMTTTQDSHACLVRILTFLLFLIPICLEKTDMDEKTYLSSVSKKTYLHGFLEEFLKLFKCLFSSGIHTVSRWFDILIQALHQERIPTRLALVP